MLKGFGNWRKKIKQLHLEWKLFLLFELTYYTLKVPTDQVVILNKETDLFHHHQTSKVYQSIFCADSATAIALFQDFVGDSFKLEFTLSIYIFVNICGFTL